MAAMRYHGIQVNGVLTSEDVKAYKPRAALFQEALARYELRVDQVLHVGDSIRSDVYGAQMLGIDAVWLNRKGKPADAHIRPRYVCDDLYGVMDVVSGLQ